MLRAAAKNQARVAVVVDPADYATLVEAIGRAPGTRWSQRRFAAKAYAHTAHYDGLIAKWFGTHAAATPTSRVSAADEPQLVPRALLRYGENPHQGAALYVESAPANRHRRDLERPGRQGTDLQQPRRCRRRARMRQGVRQAPACVIVNGSGIRAASRSARTRRKPTNAPTRPTRCPHSAASSRSTAARCDDCERDRRTPVRRSRDRTGSGQCSTSLYSEKPNVRVLAYGALRRARPETLLDFKRIAGGLLVQDADSDALTVSDLKIVSQHVSRCERAARPAVRLACGDVRQVERDRLRARGRRRHRRRPDEPRRSARRSPPSGPRKRQGLARGCAGAMASDAFFPFRDGHRCGGRRRHSRLIQPGGSMRDADVIAAADDTRSRWSSPECGISAIEYHVAGSKRR